MVRVRVSPALLLFAAFVFFPALLSAETPPAEIPLGLYLNDAFLGDYFAVLTEEEPALLRSDLRSILRDILDPQVAGRIFPPDEAEDAAVPIRRLREAGLDAEFRFDLLVVSLRVPPALRKLNEIHILRAPEAVLAEADDPADVSAFLNLYTRGEYYFSDSGDGDVDSRVPLSFMIEPMLNIRGFVAEGEVFIETHPERDYSVDYLRLVRDIPSENMRVSAGSIIFTPGGMFQARERLAGASVLRDAELAFQRKPAFSSRREIFLQNPATITVYVNDQPVRTYQLPAGRHNLESFPFQNGLNAVKIEIVEEGREPRIEEYSAPFNAELLEKGEMNYFAGAGAAQWTGESPLAAGFFRMGISDPLTLGLHGMAAADAGIGGLEAIYAAPFGNLKTTAGLSAGDDRDPDFGAEVLYRFAVAGRRAYPILGLGAAYYGRGYLPPDSLSAGNLYSWRFNAAASQVLPGNAGVNFSVNYLKGRDGQDDSISGTVGLNKNFGKGFSLSCSLGADRLSGGDVSLRGNITLTSAPPGDRRSFSLNHNLKGGASAYYQVRPKTYLGSPGFTAAIDGLPFREDAAASVRGGVQFNHEFFESSVSDTLSRGADNSSAAANRLAWSAASSVAFADGAWGVSRPIRDGFAIVVPGKSLADKEILINHGADFRVRSARERMPAVLPNLRAYTTSRIHMNVPELPLEQQAEVFQHFLAPTYKTGYVLRMETAPRLYGGGRNVYRDGSPIALQAGEVYAPGNEKFEPIIFYSEESGAFQFYDLRPGTYAVRMYMSESAVQEFTIPEGVEGLFDIGDVWIPGPP